MTSNKVENNLIKIYEKLLNHFGKQNWWPLIGSKKTKRIEIIIGAILTQNTSWKNVEKVIKKIKERNLLNRSNILRISDEELQKIIKPCGYYKQKTKRLKEAIKRIRGKITREKLLEINGIGKETCDVILLYAYEKPYFVIDTYTRRILDRLGIIKNAFKKSYDEIQEFFHNNLPRDIEIYKEYHALLDELAKKYCKKKVAHCEYCPIIEFCDFGNKKLGIRNEE